MIKLTNLETYNLPNIDTDKYDIYISDLSEVPYIENTKQSKNGKNGLIDFYNVPEGIKTLAFNEATNSLCWSDVAFWSKHYSRDIIIVNLSYDLQIITDDDPRAIYGITLDNLSKKNYIYERATPSEALSKNILIPVNLSFLNKIKSKSIAKQEIDIKEINKNIDSFNTAKSVLLDYFLNKNILLKLNFINNKWKLEIADFEPFKNFFKDEITFIPIKSIINTLQKEDGYDLTVPNSDTFTSFNGIVLSNTINVHVPALPEAIQDTKNKLMPSKQVFSIRDNSKIANPLKQDLIVSLYSKNKEAPNKRYLFKTKKEAIQAIKSGKVKFNDEVEILND